MSRFFLLLIILLSSVISTQAQRIAVLSDVHVSPASKTDSMLRLAVDEINASHYDLVVMNGDLTNEGSDHELINVKQILDRITHPFVAIPGNHENNWSQSATRTFVKLWNNDRFCFDLDSTIAVGINCGPYMKMGDGHIKQEDLHWLHNILVNGKNQGKRIISFNHYPLQDDIDNWTAYVNLLEQFPVIGHINGHYHAWQQYNGGDINAAMVRALDMRDGTFGYAIVDINSDSIRVSEKVISQEAKTKFTWPVVTQHHITRFKPQQETTLPADVIVEKIHTDSASIFTRLAFDKDNIYFGNSLGDIKAIDKRNGDLKWSVQLGSPIFSRPVVLNACRLAVPHAEGIAILDCHNGQQIEKLYSVGSPYVADGIANDTLYIQGGYKIFQRLNPDNGVTIWAYDSIDNYCQAAPVLDGNEIFFGAWDTQLRCLRATDGKLLWQWNNGRKNNMLSPGNVVPAVTARQIIIVAPDRYMTAIDRQSGETIWRDNTYRYRESLGRSDDGTKVYAKTMDGQLVAVDSNSDSFTPLWVTDLGIGYDHAPCVIAECNGVAYVGSRRGVLCAVRAIDGQLLWTKKIGNGEINGIDIDPFTGEPYLSIIDGTVFRITVNNQLK